MTLVPGVADCHDAAAAEEGVPPSAALHGLARLHHPKAAPIPSRQGQPGVNFINILCA
jgi:hypothetical protein